MTKPLDEFVSDSSGRELLRHRRQQQEQFFGGGVSKFNVVNVVVHFDKLHGTACGSNAVIEGLARCGVIERPTGQVDRRHSSKRDHN